MRKSIAARRVSASAAAIPHPSRLRTVLEFPQLRAVVVLPPSTSPFWFLRRGKRVGYIMQIRRLGRLA